MSPFRPTSRRGGFLLGMITLCTPPAATAVDEPWAIPPGLQSDPALVGRGEETVALWSDTREPGETRLFWTRLAGDAPACDAAPVTMLESGEHHAAVAATESWILAVWESGSPTGSTLRASVLPGAGPVGPVSSTAITAPPGPVRRPSCAVREDVGLLVWEDEREGAGNLYFARWDREGGLRDAGGAPLAVGPAASYRPRVVRGGSGFGAVWSEGEGGAFGLRWRAFDAEGGPGGTVLLPTGSGTDLAPDLAWSGDRWLVVWREGPGSASARAVFLDAAGTPLGPPWPLLPAGHEALTWRAVGFDGGFWLVWQEHTSAGRDLRRGFLDRSGVLHPAGGVEIAPPQEGAADPSLAVEATGLRVAWRRPDPEDTDDLYMIRVPLDDTVSAPSPVPLTREEPAATGSRAPAPTGGLSAVPNPFSDRVRLRRERSGAGEGEAAAMEIFDVEGRRVRRLADDGSGTWTWDGQDERGMSVPPGVYFVRVGSASLRLVRVGPGR